MIVAAEGLNGSIAYRGLAYVVFEDFDLSPFGNRIPNFSFEVRADDGAPVDWLRDQAASAGIPVGEGLGDVSATGYAAFGRRLDDCGRLSRLGDFGLSFAQGRAQFAGTPRVFAIGQNDLLAAEGAITELVQGARPAAMGFGYMDPERDFQPGRQRVARSRRGQELESEAGVAASAGAALALASRLLRQAEGAAEQLRFGLSWRWLEVCVGDVVELEGLGRWRIIERNVRGLLIFLLGDRVVDPDGRPAAASDPGRSLPAPMMPSRPTDIQFFEAPVPLVGGRQAAWLWMSGSFGWRGATASLLDTADQTRIGEIRQPIAWGRLLTPVERGPETLWDRRNHLLVEMEVGVPAFESRSQSDVLDGANLVRVGAEILQFCDAEPLGGNVVRLSGLLRGQFGTGFRMRPLEPGEIVRLIPPRQLLAVDLPVDSSGRSLVVLAEGRGDPLGGTEAILAIEGLSGAPMGPVHLHVRRNVDAGLSSRWIPRSSAGWSWSNVDPPHSRWWWHFRSLDGRIVSRQVDEPALELSVAEQISMLGQAFGAGVVLVESIGDGPMDLRTSRFVTI